MAVGQFHRLSRIERKSAFFPVKYPISRSSPDPPKKAIRPIGTAIPVPKNVPPPFPGIPRTQQQQQQKKENN